MALLLISASLGLAACGGSDSSSGGGGSNNPYAGNYIGTGKYNISGAGGSQSTAEKLVLSVTDNGQVLGEALSVNTAGISCSGGSPIYLSGNSFNYTEQYSCSIPEAGTCRFNESGSGSINDNIATMRINATASCSAGNLAISLSFSGKKQ